MLCCQSLKSEWGGSTRSVSTISSISSIPVNSATYTSSGSRISYSTRRDGKNDIQQGVATTTLFYSPMKYSKQMRLLITGGTGFIGSELLLSLQNSIHEVYSLERHRTDSRNRLENRRYKIKEGDIRRGSEITQVIEKLQPEVLIHLAGLSSVASSYDDPVGYIETNLVGTVNLAQACLREVKNFKMMIFASSLYVYKDTPDVLQNEDTTPQEPNSPYGVTKLAAESYLSSLFRNYKFPSFILRLGNIYGRNRGPYSIVETLISQMLQGEKEVRLGSPEPIRDFLYISDLVNDFIKLMGSTNVNL